ncbi:MAG: DEAD/DEAH box helicase [Candidatus Nanopelagicales bacterium]|nr:DEAD/DEAH box helicase [Candidatus Nanopelagicales bacterium]
MTQYHGRAPNWALSATRQRLIDLLGPSTYHRAREYVDRELVLVLSLADPSTIEALVEGTALAPYQVTVHRSALIGPPGVSEELFTNECSCPMAFDCKHVGATLIAARGWAEASRSAPKAAWQSMLDAVVTEPLASEEIPLALRVELRQGRHDSAPRLLVNPLVKGKTRWVRTGASWRDMEQNYGRPRLRQKHRDAVMELLHLQRAHTTGFYGYGYGESKIYLDELGPNFWPVLDRVVAAGVTLLGPDDRTKLVIAPAPAGMVLDIRRTADGVVSLQGELRGDDHEPLTPTPSIIGKPAHGYWTAQPGRIELGPLSAPLDAAKMQLVNRGPIPIPEADLESFLLEYYPALRQSATVISSDASVELPDVSPPRAELSIEFRPHHVTHLVWAVSYAVGDRKRRFGFSRGFSDNSDRCRDRNAERDLLDMLTSIQPGACWNPVGPTGTIADTADLSGIDTADFVRHTLPILEDHPLVDVVSSGAPMAYTEAIEAPVVCVAANDTADPDWFDLDVAVTVEGEDVALSHLFFALAAGDERLLLDSGKSFRLDRPDLVKLRELIEEARALEDRPATSVRITPVQAGWWDELVNLGVVATQSTRWQRSVGALLNLDQVPLPGPPDDFGTTLRPYQLDGYQWLSLLWDLRLGGVLADEMGLGKTVQTLAMAARAAANGTLGGDADPLLIVAPSSVVATWKEQADAFTPQLRTATVTETEGRSGIKIRNVAENADIVVTSYALFRIDEDSYQALSWSGLVLDEAQFVKNHQSKTYRTVRKLAAPFKLAITGTPMENSLMDLWSMMSITAPGLFPNPKQFGEDYRKPIENSKDAPTLERLRRRVRPLMLRRTKDAVATDLPPKTEQLLHVTLHPKHRRIYDTYLNRERQRVLGMLDDLNRNRIAILKSLTIMRQLSLDVSLVDGASRGTIPSAKIDVLVEQLQEVAAEGHRALVFSQFTRFLGQVRTRLNDSGIATCYLDGRTRNRPRRIAEFIDGDAPAFLISLKAGGFGLNLTAADYVYVLDPWWNPATEAQAVDRAHRIGQDKPVMVYRLISTGTIEEKVLALQERKRELFAAIVDGGAAGTALNADEIRDLLNH